HLRGIEVVERGAVVLALAQDGNPAQPGLGTFQRQELEQGTVVMERHAPLVVVVVLVERVFATPGAAFQCHRYLLRYGCAPVCCRTDWLYYATFKRAVSGFFFATIRHRPRFLARLLSCN